MFALRVTLTIMLIPLLIVVDWAAYNYLGELPGHIVTALSLVAAVVGFVVLRIDPDEADPLAADRRRR